MLTRFLRSSLERLVRFDAVWLNVVSFVILLGLMLILAGCAGSLVCDGQRCSVGQDPPPNKAGEPPVGS